MSRNRRIGIPYETQSVAGDFKVVAAFDAYYVDTSEKKAKGTLDPHAVDADQVCIFDVGGAASKRPITLVVSRDEHSIAGQRELVIDDDGGGVLLTYNGSKKIWSVFRSAAGPRPHLSTAGAAPSAQCGEANKGPKAFVGLSAESNDNAGTIAITGSGADGVQALLKFARPFEAAPRSVVLFPGNTAAARLSASAFASALSREGFHVSFASVAEETAVFYYLVMG